MRRDTRWKDKDKIYSFLATGTVITETGKIIQEFDRPNADQFILSVDQQLAQLHKIHIGCNRERLESVYVIGVQYCQGVALQNL